MLVNSANDGKTIVQVICRDVSGCSHVRLRWNSLYYCGHEHLGFVPVVVPRPIFDDYYLKSTKAFICQRFLTPDDAQLITTLKAYQPKYGYKLIYEVDDQAFIINGEAIPSYNSASLAFNKNVTTFEDVLTKTLPLYDEIVVSTEYLAEAFRKRFHVENVSVVRNVVPRFLWNADRKQPLTTDLTKPKVLYSGSPCHYRNPVPCGLNAEYPYGLPGKCGDFTTGWIEWVKKNVTEDKIDFVIMGALPYFFDEIADKIKCIPWVDCNSYPRQVIKEHADFQIAPLVENVFNKCKSSLRFTESCASGCVMLGTMFEDSPYTEIHDECKVPTNVSADLIDETFWKLCKKDKYNEILDWQYNFINKNGYWLESRKHQNLWLSMVDGDVTEDILS